MTSLSTLSKCIAVLKSGLNKGSVCKNNSKHGTFCGIHKKCVSTPSDSSTLSITPSATPILNASTSVIENNNTNHAIYIVKFAEHIRCKDNIFKVGRTTRGIHNRIKGYPKNSQVLFSTHVKDAKLCERIVLENCRKEPNLKKCDRNNKEQYKRLGNEFFEGDIVPDDIQSEFL